MTKDSWVRRSVTLVVSRYQRRVGVIVREGSTSISASVEKAGFVRVLEGDRRTVKVVSSEFQTRFFMALDGETALEISAGESLD